jgi:peptidoglycan hydrolase CwlO-like protein
MSTEVLLLAVLASMTVVALMITLNTRGKWRATISAMLSACLLGGTVWLFTLQYSAIDKDEARDETQSKRQRLSLKELIPPAKQDKERQLSALLEEAGDFAAELERAALYNPSYTHEQLVARADAVASGFETLMSEVNDFKSLLAKYPDAEKQVNEAMEELKRACHLYKAYYYAENTAGEVSTERMMKSKAHDASETLVKVVKVVKSYEKP